KLDKDVDQPEPAVNRGKQRLAEALTAPVACKQLDTPLEMLPPTTQVAQREMGLPQVQIRDDLKSEIRTSVGGGEGAAAGFHGAVEITQLPTIMSQAGGDPSLPSPITDPLGKNFSFTKVLETSPVVCKVVERIAKVHPNVDPL